MCLCGCNGHQHRKAVKLPAFDKLQLCPESLGTRKFPEMSLAFMWSNEARISGFSQVSNNDAFFSKRGGRALPKRIFDRRGLVAGAPTKPHLHGHHSPGKGRSPAKTVSALRPTHALIDTHEPHNPIALALIH